MEKNPEVDEKEFEVNDELSMLGVNEAMQAEIKKEAARLKAENEGVPVVFPIVVQGAEYDDEDFYIGYFRQPSFKHFSKYVVASSQNQAGAMRQLARDCFLGGDKELVDDDSLFLFGLMGQLSEIIKVRHGVLVNLSKTGK